MLRLRHLCAQRSGAGQFLDRNGLTVGDVATWAVHLGGPRILDRVGEALDFDAGALQPAVWYSLIMATALPPPSS
jgi:predicted naringenin-chalcone synthase